MRFLINVVLVLAPIIILLMSALLIKLANLDETNRWKQIRFVVGAIVYTTAVSIVLMLMNFIFNLFFNNGLVDFILLRLFASKLRLIASLVSNGRTFVTGQLIIAVNTAVLVVFAIIKKVLARKMDRWEIPNDYNEIKGLKKYYWILIEKICQYVSNEKNETVIEKVSKVLKYTVYGISILYCAFVLLIQLQNYILKGFLTSELVNNIIICMFMWPTLLIVLMNEIRWFIEIEKKFVESDSIHETRVAPIVSGSYLEIQDDLKEVFAPFHSYSIKTTYDSENEGQNVGIKYEDKSNIPKTIEELQKRFEERHYKHANDYLSLIVDIDQKTDVIVNGSFFSELGEGLLLYLNCKLASGENVLFLSDSKETQEILREFIENEFFRANNCRNIWKIVDDDGAIGSDNYDIMLLTPEAMHDLVYKNQIIEAQRDFLEDLSTVILVNANKTVTQIGQLLALLSYRISYISKKTDDDLNYICFADGYSFGLNNAMKAITDSERDFRTYTITGSSNNVNLELWNYECLDDDHKFIWAQDLMFKNNRINTYWGVTVLFACLALSRGMKNLDVVSNSGLPYRQIVNDIRGKHILKTINNTDVADKDYDSIRFNNLNSNGDSSRVIIIEDDTFNIPMIMSKYTQYSSNREDFVNVISKKYMLRDYFSSRADSFLTNEADIGMTIPLMIRTEYRVLYIIICKMLGDGISENELISLIQASADESVKTLDQALLFCKSRFNNCECKSIEEVFLFDFKRELDFGTLKYSSNTVVKLKEPQNVEYYLPIIKCAQIKYSHSGHEFTYTTCIPSGCIYQYFIPGQGIVHQGVLYKVDSIDKDGIIRVKDASSLLDTTTDFVQVREYVVKSESETKSGKVVELNKRYESYSSSGFEFVEYTGLEIRTDTLGYYEVRIPGGMVNLLEDYTPLEDEEKEELVRNNKNARILTLAIKEVGKDEADRVSFLLAVMMNEFFKTMFPYTYQCISVCPVLNEPEVLYGDTTGSQIRDVYPKIDIGDYIDHSTNDAMVVIIEDSDCDLGVINALNSVDSFRQLFNGLLNYLRWNEGVDNSDKYLYFGSDSEPECFNFELLTTICDEFVNYTRTNESYSSGSRIRKYKHCCFCHASLVEGTYDVIHDEIRRKDRIICKNCSSSRITNLDELHRMFEETKAYLINTYGVDFNNTVAVKFASAETIVDMLRHGDQREVISNSNPITHELEIEAGAPRAYIMAALAHELTHMWQNDNVTIKDQLYLDGHAAYVEVEFLKHLNYDELATWFETRLNRGCDYSSRGYTVLKEELSLTSDNCFVYIKKKFSGGNKVQKKITGKNYVRNVLTLRKYGYSCLDAEEKRVYDAIKKAVYDLEKKVDLTGFSMSVNDVRTIIAYFESDSPEVFWWNFWPTILYKDKKATSIDLEYCLTKEQINDRQKCIESNISSFLEGVTEEKSDFEVTKIIHDNLVKLLDYDSITLAIQKKSARKKNEPDDIRSIYGAFVDRKVVCVGYAKALQYLLNLMGIECSYVCNDTHAWNLVCLEGDYYYMDVTWDDYSNTDKSKSSEGIAYSYFCITTEELHIDHKPCYEPAKVPNCVATKCNYFVHEDVYFPYYDSALVKQVITKKLASNPKSIYLKFRDESSCNEAIKELVDKKVLFSILEDQKLKCAYSWRHSDKKNILEFTFN